MHPIRRWRIPPRALIWLAQVAIFALAGFSAFLLRFEFDIPEHQWEHIAWSVPVWVVVKFAVFRLMGLDHGWWAHPSAPDLMSVGIANLAGSFLSAAAILAVAPLGFPRTIYLLDLLLCSYSTGGARVLARLARNGAFRRQNGGRRAVIYGAGDAGAILLREIRDNPRPDYRVCGFLDDDPSKKGMRVHMAPVLGAGRDLPALAARHGIEEVLVAMPSAGGHHLTRILGYCHQVGLRCKTVPSLRELIRTDGLAMQVRDVAVEDLLGRTPVHLETEAIRAKLEGQVVLATGAAGSIGSELCRHIARFSPRAIVGYDIAETALFELDREMRAAFPGVLFQPEIGSVQNEQRLGEVFRAYAPTVVYHAAAYKHVPMMESHVFEAAENNTLGTHAVARAAARFRARDFVMISSDKAVRPTNIMGLTKRAAELLVHSMQNGATKFVSVRFGNVLGSNGSVVPIFKRQIAAGGPVTVTHPEMQRYFMTIPEAAQLVLQASTMGKGGEIFVLDMGEPVKVLDLARNLILLSGLRPDRDIRIEFTGARPGEKLFEELRAYNENTLPTWHEKIKVFAGNGAPEGSMAGRIEAIRSLCEIRDAKALILEMKELVPEYNPSMHVLRALLGETRYS